MTVEDDLKHVSVDEKPKNADKPLSNLERLQGHLKPGSLAARLVAAQMKPGDAAPQEALKKVMRDRLDELRLHHAAPPNPKD